MRATKAYIASLGTTGVLLAASLLMLAVVSAVVAFDRWPDGQVSSRVQTLVLKERPASIRVSARASAAASATPARLAAAPGIRATPGAPALVGEGLTGGSRTAPVTPTGTVPATPAAPALPKTPQLPSPEGIPDLISNPGTTAGQIADGAQSVTDTAGVSLGKVNPDLGNAVAGSGQAVANTVRQIPLPSHVVPGH